MTNAFVVPRWVVAYLWVTVALAALFSVLAYLNPEIQFVAWSALHSAGALSLAGPLGLYIARNVATVAATVFALIGNSVPAVRTALILRAVTDVMDCLHNVLSGNVPGALFAGGMFAIEVIALLSVRDKD